MFQTQSEVRPAVTRMPMDGYVLQTGGSARRRVIKPLNKQEKNGTNVYPIQNEYRVSGVPGHTHNSSAVASVLVDLTQTRGFSKSFNAEWSEKAIELKTDQPGDSDAYDNSDPRFERALERGIGEIALRPENCHHEIREPVRSISEVRTLVAPDDRLQTLTYVEEVGGFVDTKKKAYISDFPIVNVDFLCYRDPASAEVYGSGGNSNVYKSLEPDSNTPILIESLKTGRANFVVQLPTDNTTSVGTLTDGTDWHGIVPFRWNDDQKLYESESFVVKFRRVFEIQANMQNGALAARTLTVRFPVIKSTVASNGYCFLMAAEINPPQAIRSATNANGKEYVPFFPLEILDTTVTQSRFYYRLDCAYRIMVGGSFAFPGPSAFSADRSYYKQLESVQPLQLCKRYAEAYKTVADIQQSWDSDAQIKPQFRHGSFFDVLNLTNFNNPRVYARNNQAGACYEGFTKKPYVFRAQAVQPFSNQPVDINYTDAALRGHQPIAFRLESVNNPTANADDWKLTHPDPSLDNARLARQLPTLTLFETDVAYELDESKVRPSKFISDEPDRIPRYVDHPPGERTTATSYWYWKAQLLPSITSTQNAALADADKVPSSRTWMLPRPDHTGYKLMTVHGTNFDLGNSKIRSANMDMDEQFIMVPATIDFYFDTDYMDFDYDAGYDSDGEEDFELSTLSEKDPDRSHVFYIVGDVYRNGDAIGVNAHVQPLFDLAETQLATGTLKANIHVVDVMLPDDRRFGHDGANMPYFKEGFGVGTMFECDNHALLAANSANPDPTVDQNSRIPVMYRVSNSTKYSESGVAGLELFVQNLYFTFSENRTFFVAVNDVGKRSAPTTPNLLYFHTKDTRVETANDKTTVAGGAGNLCVVTVIEKLYTKDGTLATAASVTALGNKAQLLTNAGLTDRFLDQRDYLGFCCLGKNFQDTWFGSPSDGGAVTVFDAHKAESNLLGPVFQSKRRISQHLCAPILNPNMRIGCTAPLNFETGHLPPELRDFRLELRDVDFSNVPGKVLLESLVLYEFNGGNQVVTAVDNLLHLPQFHEDYATVQTDGTFDFEVFSPYGMPSYIALFCRDTDRKRDHLTQPLIKQLSIMCSTTQKKSNTILEADVHQLYHITQRNVNQRARYNRATFNKRQVVLLSAEDIGMMGLESYQTEKRAQFRFNGTVDQIGRVTALLIYNNRGLYIQGKHMSVLRLKD